MKDKLTFPTFTHDAICGYCNDKALYAQYKNDKKSKYIGTKQMWQELSKLQDLLYITNSALVDAQLYLMHDTNMSESEVLEHIIYAGNCVGHGGEIYKRKKNKSKKGLKMTNNTEKTLTFEQKRTMVLRKGFKEWEIDVVETWYDIESEDEDISTERLMALTADSCDVEVDEVATTMCKFQEKYDRIFGDE